MEYTPPKIMIFQVETIDYDNQQFIELGEIKIDMEEYKEIMTKIENKMERYKFSPKSLADKRAREKYPNQKIYLLRIVGYEY